ncbi:S1C family serine protease [Bythopirellula goksoeyrii]|uniref:Putative periplasmic serine endoprotease DegP-like n=1 Tax=Bythopirellula goksoeyrii TaxID=1400387 RepID=A0A5B9QKD0_9BACT|nr:trypsin-like peptidase domain-containing protein [Bythopirellula goksoeyrii]QEG34563.1 putative periplasmic serine endoprotease DegP-like precursor [Bythopirellula goksoeyrii]
MQQEPHSDEFGALPVVEVRNQTTPSLLAETVPADQLVTQKDLSRLRRLLWIFGILMALLIAPSLAGRIQYALVEAEERAKFDVASDNIHQLDLMQLNDASRMLFDYVSPSVVHIRTHRGRDMGQGAGVIVDEAGYIVTNYHVVEGVGSLEVQLSDGRRGPASVIGSDPLVDVAVLKTELDDLHAAQWGDSDNLNVGEWVWALGSPFGFQKSITFGILSAKNRRGITTARDPGVSTERSSIYQEFLQTDAAVNPGNSGGPLVNVEGKIIGINTAIYGNTYQGISFSIPSSIAQASYEQLRKVGHVDRGYLGVGPRLVPDPVARLLGLEKDQGVLVADIRDDTPAEDAGIELGDVLLTWNGEEYSDPTLLSRAIAATPIGTTVPVDLIRQNRDGIKRLTVQVKVGARPQNESL